MSIVDRLSRIVDRARSDPAPAPDRIRPDPAAGGPMDDGAARLRRASGRARAEQGRSFGWDAESREGETLLDTVSRVVSEGMPPALSIERSVGLAQLREEFAALGAGERDDEIGRHLWFRSVPGRIRTHFSPLLDAIGVEAPLDRT